MVLCRLYLADYLCIGYPLPADCSFLQSEFDLAEQVYRDYEAKITIEGGWKAVLRSWLPGWILRWLAYLFCLPRWNHPECLSSYTHGPDASPDINKEEL